MMNINGINNKIIIYYINIYYINYIDSYIYIFIIISIILYIIYIYNINLFFLIFF